MFVGEARETDADLVQFYERENGHRARDAVLLRGGERVGTVVDLPWEEGDPQHLERARSTRGPRDARRRPRRRGTSRAAIAAVRPWAVDSARSTELSPGVKDHDACARGSRQRDDDDDLRRLRRPVRAGDADPGARRADGRRGSRCAPTRRSTPSSTSCCTNYAGRPTPLTRAARFAPDQRVYLKREDLLHTGAHKINNALGQAVRRAPARQAADHRRDGRRPARRRDGNRLRALRARVHRLHGQRGHAPPGAERRADAPARRRGAPGRVRHAHAQGGDERGDPRLDRERRDTLLPDRLVRRPGAVPGARARAAARDRPRGARADPRGRRPTAGGRDRLRRRRLERDRHVLRTSSRTRTCG